VIPTVNKDNIAVPGFNDALASVFSAVEMLKCKPLGVSHSEVVDLVQVDFRGRIVCVVFVRRIARPVPAGSVNLDYHEFVSREDWRDDVHDLAGGVSSTPQ
jgi:hypothetical protein